MKRNPIYVFDDLTSIGIFNVPINSSVQVNIVDATEIPKTFKLKGKIGVTSTTTIGQFLAGDVTNFIDLNEITEIPSELEKIGSAPVFGWRMLGRLDSDYAPIGINAIDMSFANWPGLNTSTYGASGAYSFTGGINTTASAYASVAFGIETISKNSAGIALGKYNKGTSTSNILEVGIGDGASSASRKNALEISLHGGLKAPELTISDIELSGIRSLVTKEYADAGIENKYDKIGGLISGDVIIDSTDPLTNSLTNKGTALFEKDVRFNTSITVGKNILQNSEIVFSDTDPSATPSLYWDNAQKDFYVQTLQNTDLKIWHSGNDGKTSELDAAYLGGVKWDQYPTNNDLVDGLSGKYDKSGGLIAGDSTISGDLVVNNKGSFFKIEVQSTSSYSGRITAQEADFSGRVNFGDKVYLDSIDSDIVFKGISTFDEELHASQGITTSNITINPNVDRNAVIEFIDANNATRVPSIYWSTDQNKFLLKTREVSPNNGPFEIWHSGNFSPSTNVNSYLDLADTPIDYTGSAGKLVSVNTQENGLEFVVGNSQGAEWGFITGILSDQTDLSNELNNRIKKTHSTSQTISNSLVVGLDLEVYNNLTVSGSTTVELLSVTDINTDVTFHGNIDVAGSNVSNFVQSNTGMKVGLMTTNIAGVNAINSRIEFTGIAGSSNLTPAIFYDTVAEAFKISDGTGVDRPIQLSGGSGSGYASLTSVNTFTENNYFEGEVKLTGIFGITTPELDVHSAFITVGERSTNSQLQSGITTEHLEFDSATSTTIQTGNFSSIYWDSSQYQWAVDIVKNDGTPATGFRLWHDGNFSPTTKFDNIGGTIQGNVNIEPNVANNAEGNLTVSSDLNIDGNIHFSGNKQGDQTFVVEPEVITTDIGSDELIIQASQVNFSNLPTIDPGVPGQLWDNNGVLSISQ